VPRCNPDKPVGMVFLCPMLNPVGMVFLCPTLQAFGYGALVSYTLGLGVLVSYLKMQTSTLNPKP
jgi:hypothetical protein